MFLLILTTAVSFLGAFIPILIKPVLSYLCMESKQETVLQNEILAIRREMTHISMTDEFAKHARLQRQLNKIQEELKHRANARLSFNVKLNVVITYLAQILMVLIMLFLVWSYKYTPVIVVPAKWLSPVGSIFSWPTQAAGAISITVWFIITGTVARLAAASFKSLKRV